MVLDIICAIMVVLAVLKGYGQGLIVGVFSFIAIIIGLAAALKLSAAVAVYIGLAVNVSEEWLPLISFVVVFIIIVLLVRLGARALQNVVEVVMLGWANRIGGALFFTAIYLTVFSILLFYAVHMKWLPQSVIDKSATYSYIQPIGPKVINSFGSLLPFFKDMFAELQQFFGTVANQANTGN
jgi:membrane protein required for colicin V production